MPLRIELGPKDIENNACEVGRRDNGEKTVVSLDKKKKKLPELLKAVHDGLYNKAIERRAVMTYDAKNLDEMKEIADTKPGFIRAMWCGDSECEDKLKDITGGVKSRCIPFEEENISDTCVCCGKKAKHMVVWGRQY